MAQTIKDVFDEHLSITADRKLMKEVLSYVKHFARKNEDHIQFLGGNLIGVHKFKYVIGIDDVAWLDGILDCDDRNSLRIDIRQVMLDQDLNPDYFISGSFLNQSFFYLAHKVYVSSHYSETDKERLLTEIFVMLQYKFFSSIYTRWFKGVNEGLAMALYESLSRKWGIKKYGTWQKLFEARAKDIFSKSSKWRPVIEKMDDDALLVDAINDTHGRIKSVLGNLMGLLRELREKEAKIATTGRFTMAGDESVLREHSNKYERMRDRIKDIVPEKNSLINDALVTATVKVVPTVSEPLLRKVLEYLSANYNGRKHKEYADLLDDIIIYMFDVMRKEHMSFDDIGMLMLKLRNMYRSSQATDATLKSVRERTGDLVSDALNTTSNSVIATTRIGVILYIVVRALVIK